MLANQVYQLDEFVYTLGIYLGKKFRVEVMHAHALEVDVGNININAYYDQDLDERRKRSIELVIVTNPADTHYILDRDEVRSLIVKVADSLAHELIHMRQARARHFIDVDLPKRQFRKYDEAIQYLADPNEIDAYAYNIATELRDHPNPISKLSSVGSIQISDSVNLWAYWNTFRADANNPVLKKLFKKIYKNLTTPQT
jgi:hypothetical protein